MSNISAFLHNNKNTIIPITAIVTVGSCYCYIIYKVTKYNNSLEMIHNKTTFKLQPMS